MPLKHRETAILTKQTDQLYESLIFSAAGSLVVAVVLVVIVGLKSDTTTAWSWFAMLSLINLYRLNRAVAYGRLSFQEKQQKNWRRSFNISTILAATIWSSSLWLFYPQDAPIYQAMMILALAGIIGGAITSLAYDRYILTAYILIILLNIEARLILENNSFSYELALLALLYNLFLLKNGQSFGTKNLELLALREDTYEHSLTLLSATETAAHIGYWQWDDELKQLKLSTNLAAMCCISAQHVSLEFYLDKIHKDDRKQTRMAIDAACNHGEESSIEYRLQGDKNSPWITMNQIIKQITDISGEQSTLGTVQDISAIKSAEQKIMDMAYFDDLTGLANRGYFRQHLIEELKHADRNRSHLALIYIDIAGFKKINDDFGYAYGDLFLQKFAVQLKKIIRTEDFLARIGGNEFSLTMTNLKDNKAAIEITQRCLDKHCYNINIDGHHLSPKLHIGIAIYPQDGNDVDTLLKAIDTAMYTAKREPEHKLVFYNTSMTEQIAQRLKLEQDLQQAIPNGELKLAYQPKVSLKNSKMSGVEALIRWHHPDRGMVPPNEFIPTAERIGLINKIGEWALTTACQQLQQWKADGLKLDMAVNVSSSHFSSSGFVDVVNRAKLDHDLKSGELEIEITESMSRNTEQHIGVSQKLHDLGIKIAVDDFGTGYSSLSVLKQLQIDTIKIDREFIHNLPDDQASVMMAKAIISMSIGLNFNIIAEGVETLEQLKFLQQLGCTCIQGYYFSRPVEADEIPPLAAIEFEIT